MPPPKRRLSHEQIVFAQALSGALPAAAVAFWFLWLADSAPSPKVQWTLTLIIGACWIGFAVAVRSRVVRPLQTMANLLSALREGDFAIRARDARHDEPLGDLLAEINSLSRTLQEQRLNAVEATTLLRTVMNEIDIAIFAFDGDRKLRLANRAAQHLLGKSSERILGCDAGELGLLDCLEGDAARILPLSFPGTTGRWGMRRSGFHEGGRPHQLVVLADLSRPLRDEELRAWRRIVRVLGHELNNSLAPIKSLAGSLGSLLRRRERAPDWEDDMLSGLDIIGTRADSLARFLHAYAQLARLPRPTLAPCPLGPLIARVVALESRLRIDTRPSPELTLHCDAAQLEQLLINLAKNAVEAALEQRAAGRIHAGVCLYWRHAHRDDCVEIVIEDDGPGIAQATNLFVPFFTTKRDGSGIGLVLCRQIAENHGGALTLTNRKNTSGCIATLRLPI